MSTKHKFSFAQKLPLYYFAFVAVFVLIYFLISSAIDTGNLRDASVADAAIQRGEVRRICVSPPPCIQNSFVCWFRSIFAAERCKDVPVPIATPVASVNPSPEVSSIPYPSITCIPRPPCLDDKPYQCKIAEPVGGWCPKPKVTIAPTPTNEPVFCSQEMVLCSDGSYAARDPNNSCKPKCPLKPKYSCMPRPPCTTSDSGLQVCSLDRQMEFVDPCVYLDAQ